MENDEKHPVSEMPRINYQIRQLAVPLDEQNTVYKMSWLIKRKEHGMCDLWALYLVYKFKRLHNIIYRPYRPYNMDHIIWTIFYTSQSRVRREWMHMFTFQGPCGFKISDQKRKTHLVWRQSWFKICSSPVRCRYFPSVFEILILNSLRLA